MACHSQMGSIHTKPPSELVTQTKRHPPQVTVQMNEYTSKTLEINNSFSELDQG